MFRKLLFIFLLSSLSLVCFAVNRAPINLYYIPREEIPIDEELSLKSMIAEEPMTLVDKLFGTSVYFDQLKDRDALKNIYKEVIKEVALEAMLDQTIVLRDQIFLTLGTEGKAYSGVETFMESFYTFYSHYVKNNYVNSHNAFSKVINNLKKFGRIDTKISQKWLEVQSGLGTAAEFLKFAKYVPILASLDMQALHWDFALSRIKLLDETVKRYESDNNISPVFKQALYEVKTELEDLQTSKAWEKYLNALLEEIKDKKYDLSSDTITTAMKPLLSGAMAKAGITGIPAFGWLFAAQFSVETIASGLRAKEKASKFLVAGDLLYWLRKIRENINLTDKEYVELGIMELYSQKYFNELMKSFLTDRVIKFVFWVAEERKEVIEDLDKISLNIEKSILYLLHESYGAKKAHEIALEGIKAYHHHAESDDCLEYFDEALKLYPICPTALAGLGNYYLYGGYNSTSRNFEKGKELVIEAWSWDYCKDNTYVWKAYGYLYHIEGDTKRAEVYYEKAIELDPNNPYPYYNIGVIYAEREKYETAMSYYEKAIELDPNYPYPYNNIGVIYNNHYKDYELAEKYYLKAHELDPTIELVIWNLYFTYLNMGNTERADEFLENAFEQFDDSPKD